MVILLPPAFNNVPGFLQSVKQITIDTFFSELADETFNISILPGTAGGDVDRLTTLLRQPVLHLFGDQFWSIVAANVLGSSINQE